jgi:hypothetical protein
MGNRPDGLMRKVEREEDEEDDDDDDEEEEEEEEEEIFSDQNKPKHYLGCNRKKGKYWQKKNRRKPRICCHFVLR